jgi:surface antigen
MMRVITLAVTLLITGCATAPRTVPTINFMATVLGDVLSAEDQKKADQVLETGSENRAVTWMSRSKKLSVMPTRTFTKGSLDCRDYTVVYGELTRKGTACRNENATWFTP